MIQIYIPDYKILISNNIKLLRNEYIQIQRMINELKDELLKANNHFSLDLFLNDLTTFSEEIKAHLTQQEYQQGCNECGAQFDEECRKISEIGYCPSWEDYKEREQNLK